LKLPKPCVVSAPRGSLRFVVEVAGPPGLPAAGPPFAPAVPGALPSNEAALSDTVPVVELAVPAAELTAPAAEFTAFGTVPPVAFAAPPATLAALFEVFVAVGAAEVLLVGSPAGADPPSEGAPPLAGSPPLVGVAGPAGFPEVREGSVGAVFTGVAGESFLLAIPEESLRWVLPRGSLGPRGQASLLLLGPALAWGA